MKFLMHWHDITRFDDFGAKLNSILVALSLGKYMHIYGLQIYLEANKNAKTYYI